MQASIPDNYTLSISKKQLAELPRAVFHGAIRLVETLEEVAPAIAELREAEGPLGFDTETRPTFKKGQTHLVSLVQLSTRRCCYLFRINKTGLAPELLSLLNDAGVRKVGLSIHDDFHNLGKIAAIEPGGFTDLQDYARNFGIADKSLSRIYAIVFGRRISKGQRLTNWEAPELTPNQQTYAALDALACIEIFDALESGDFNPAASPYICIPEPPEPES